MRSLLAVSGIAIFQCAALFALEPIGGPEVVNGVSGRPTMNEDGRLLAFESTARLVPDDMDKEQDVYLVDLASGGIRRMPRSVSSARAGGPCLSPEGRFVAYHVVEIASKPDIQPLAVVLIHDLETGRTRRLPPAWYGIKADGEALFPSVGKNARSVAFTSNAAGLAVRRDLAVRGVFVFETDSDRIRFVSRNQNAVPANRPSSEARISGDGRFVGFLSAATNLEPELPTDSLSYHLYLADRTEGTMIRIDQIERGFNSDEWIAGRFDMNDDGQSLVFEARQRISGRPDDSLKTNNLFVFDLSSGAVTRLTMGLFAGKSHSPSVSGSGRWTAFVFDGNTSDPGGVVVYDRERDSWRRVVDGKCWNPDISGDGRWVAFESNDPKITGDKNKKNRVYVVPNPSHESDGPNAGD